MHEARRDRPAKVAAWEERIAKEQVFVPHNQGALWTGIGSATAIKLAKEMNLFTLEMTALGANLDHGPMRAELVRDFGESWIAEKRLIFKVASLKFLDSLSGMVTVFLPEGLERPRDGADGSFAYAVKIVWDELREADFGDPRKAIHKITSMRVCRVKGDAVVSALFMEKSDQLH